MGMLPSNVTNNYILRTSTSVQIPLETRCYTKSDVTWKLSKHIDWLQAYFSTLNLKSLSISDFVKTGFIYKVIKKQAILIAS